MNPSPSRRDPAQPLQGAKVVVAVGGGIAAYKAAQLVRLLTKSGAEVQVAMTRRAQAFIGAMTFQALTGRPVFTDVFDAQQEGQIGHIAIADWADLVIVAPATANVLARMAAGLADDPVTTLVLATRAPVLVAPSMNVNMWQNPLTRANVTKLVDVAGVRVVGPGDGFLACGWTGPGRMAEPEDILEAAAQTLCAADLAGQRVTITAGPTFEPIDPVRFIGNRSSGKMGYRLAEAARRRGATVTLITGPTALPAPRGVDVIHVERADDLAAAVTARRATDDVIIMAAAVADFRPRQVAPQKLKRRELTEAPRIELVANPDILKGLGAARRGPRPLLVGFAAETHDVLTYARAKLREKRCDLMVANDVSPGGHPFGSDANQVTLIDGDGEVALPAASKAAVAHGILDRVVALLARPTAPTPSPRANRPAAARPKARAAPGRPSRR